MKQSKQKKHHKITRSRTKQSEGEYKIIREDTNGEEEGGIFLDKADIQIIYNALKQYKPTPEEAQSYELLLETFDEEIWEDEHKDDEA